MSVSANLSLSKFMTNYIRPVYRVANSAKTQNLKFSVEISARKKYLNQHIRHMTTKSNIMNICAILEKIGKYLQLIDSSKHSKHDQIKIDKVNHCNFNDLKKYLLPWLIVITIKTGHQLVEANMCHLK